MLPLLVLPRRSLSLSCRMMKPRRFHPLPPRHRPPLSPREVWWNKRLFRRGETVPGRCCYSCRCRRGSAWRAARRSSQSSSTSNSKRSFRETIGGTWGVKKKTKKKRKKKMKAPQGAGFVFPTSGWIALAEDALGRDSGASCIPPACGRLPRE